jgi:hypothetical protein
MQKNRQHTAFLKRILSGPDQESSKQKRSRSEWVELHFENLFFNQPELEETAIRTL